MIQRGFLIISLYFFANQIIFGQDCNSHLQNFQSEYNQKQEKSSEKIDYGTGISKYDSTEFEKAKKHIVYFLACKAEDIGYDNLTLSKLRNCIDFIYRDDTHLIIAGEYDPKKLQDQNKFPNTYYVINPNFEIINEYDHVYQGSVSLGDPYNKDIYIVTKDRKKGIIDRNGKELLKPNYDEIRWFKDDRIIIRKNNKNGFADNNGNIIMQPKYDDCHSTFSDGYLTVKNGSYPNEKFGLVDKQGKEIITPQYEIAGNFFGDLLPVYKDKKWGFVNTKNEIIIPFSYEMIGDNNGFGYNKKNVWYYEVQKKWKGKKSYINKKGKEFPYKEDVEN